MSSPSTRVALACGLWAALLSPGAARAQPPGSRPPVYTQRLQMPVRGDDLVQPRAVEADLHAGEVFVCDTLRNRVVVFDAEGRYRYQFPGGSAFQSPVDLAVDADGYLFVLGQVSDLVALLDFDGRLIRRLEITGFPEGTGDSRFNSLVVSPDGATLYLLDVENDRLWIVDRDGAVRSSIDLRAGRSPTEVEELRYGKVDLYGDSLLVSIASEGLVQVFDLQGRPTATVGARGSAECQTIFPVAAALDDEGRMLILDQQRALFMTWDVERNTCLSEHYGFGNAPGAFYQPNDFSLDLAGRLFVSQGFEGRVQVYEGARPAPAPAAEAAVPSGSGVVPPETPSPLAPAGGEAEAPAAPGPLAEVELETAPAAGGDTTSVAAAVAPHAPAGLPAIVEGARLSVERAPSYDASYVEIGYPGGLVPWDRGSAVDVVIRAFLHAGVDLQREVHEDITAALEAYGILEPDPNIDHRRVRNLGRFFERHAAVLPTALDAEWAPGDVVFWDRNSDGVAGHVGVVTAEPGPSGAPLVIHHHRREGSFAGVPEVADVLGRWPVVGHYRWAPPSEER